MLINPAHCYITASNSLLDSNATMNDLVIAWCSRGVNPVYSEDDINDNIYPVDRRLVPPAVANTIVASGALLENYFVQRYIAVNDLADLIPVGVPESSNGGVQRAWQWIQNLPNVNEIPRSDGKYYFDLTAHLDFRGLTLAEFNTADAALTLLEVEDLPAYPVLP